MIVVPTRIPDVLLLQPTAHADARGRFVPTWDDDWLRRLPPGTRFVRSGEAHNPTVHTLRGLHLQRGLGKLVRAVRGRVFDVVVDLRVGSPTHGQWESEILVDDGRSLWIPPGFAHGYLTLEADSVVVYQFTGPHVPTDEGGVRWDDPTLSIPWPAAPALMSERDRELPGFVAPADPVRR